MARGFFWMLGQGMDTHIHCNSEAFFKLQGGACESAVTFDQDARKMHGREGKHS
jgi:hypothetical protein